MKQISDKEIWLARMGQEDKSELLLEEEYFKARQEHRLKVQRGKIHKKRWLEKERLQRILESEERFILAGGDIEDLEFFLTYEDKRLILKDDGRKKLNTENKRKKRLADKLRLEKIQEKEEVVSDVLEACAEIAKQKSGTAELIVEDAVEYVSSLNLAISLEDLRFREKIERQKVLYRERVKRMRSKKKEMYSCKSGMETTY